MKRALALVAALALLAVPWVQGEPTYTKVSASQVVANTTLPENTKTVLLVNDGANEVYYRLFTSGETAADATTASAELKSGESVSFTYLPGSTDKGAGYYKTLSIICAAGESATVRVSSK